MSDAHVQMPDTRALEAATLEVVERRGGRASVGDILSDVADLLGLDDAQRSAPHGAGPTTELYYRLAWVRKGLQDAGRLLNESRGVWVLPSLVAVGDNTAGAIAAAAPLPLPAGARLLELPRDPATASTLTLLASQHLILEELLARGAIRTLANPTREYAVGLATAALGGDESGASESAWDVRVPRADGGDWRVEVRASLTSDALADRERSSRAATKEGVTHVCLVVFDDAFDVHQALLVPRDRLDMVAASGTGFAFGGGEVADLTSDFAAARRLDDSTPGRVRRGVVSVVNSPRWLAAMATALVVASTAIYSQSEGAGVWTSLYWTLVTATTVGYGDITPHTAVGRVLSVVLVVVTILVLVPTVTAQLVTRLVHDRDTWTHEEQEEMKRNVRELIAHARVNRPH